MKAKSCRENTCGICVYFRSGGRDLESRIPGLTVLSSADSATRGGDGLCLHHDRFTGPAASCAAFSAVESS